MVKLGCVIFEIREWADRLTDRPTDVSDGNETKTETVTFQTETMTKIPDPKGQDQDNIKTVIFTLLQDKDKTVTLLSFKTNEQTQ